MTLDPVPLCLTVQGAVAAAAVAGMLALCGDSSFGTAKIKDLQGLRAKLLSDLVSSLVLNLKPILSLPSTLIDESGDPLRPSAQVSVIGQEAFKDQVREFVKFGWRNMLDLRRTWDLEEDLNRSLSCLGKAVWGCLVVALTACAWVVAVTIGWMDANSMKIDRISYVVVGVLIMIIVVMLWRIVRSSTAVSHLKNVHADL